MFTRKIILKLIVLVLPLGIFASPIQITSNAAEIQTFGADTQMYFYHNAYIDGDEFFLSGDLIQISISNDSQQTSNVVNLTAVKEIHAMGNATFEQSQYGGKADQISIYPSTKFIVLEGNAEIQDANLGTMYGQTLTLDLENKRIKTEGSESEHSTISIDNIAKFKQNNMLKTRDGRNHQ